MAMLAAELLSLETHARVGGVGIIYSAVMSSCMPGRPYSLVSALWGLPHGVRGVKPGDGAHEI